MDESVLRDYFEDKITAEALYINVENSEITTSHDVIRVRINQINDGGVYEVGVKHLLKLCNDTLFGYLETHHPATISFALICSEYFEWDNDIVDTTIFDWDNQLINFPVNNENLAKWKVYLETGEHLLRQ